ncbi:MAG: hypothetical protein ACPG4Z_06340 [Chitinophagales bacterium]
MDINVDIARLQKEIASKLGLESENVIFDYVQNDNIFTLSLITVNPRHEQSFLYHTEKGISKLEALEKMLEYVNKDHKEEDSYTIQWRKMNGIELHTSYFKAKNMYDALDKFYFNRELNSCTVFQISLNPVA